MIFIRIAWIFAGAVLLAYGWERYTPEIMVVLTGVPALGLTITLAAEAICREIRRGRH